MKHLCIGLGLLTALLIAALSTVAALGATAQAVEPLLTAAADSSLAGDMAEAAAAAGRARAVWQTRRGLTASLVEHAHLEEIDLGFERLSVLAAQGDSAGFAAECRELRARFRSLAEAERGYYYNFL